MARLEFDAIVERTPGGGGGALVALPREAAQVFGTRARFPVKATFNGVPYRGSTMPMGDGTFCLGVTKAIRAQSGAGVGDTVRVVVERDDEERTVDVPPDLHRALAAAGLVDRFGRLPYTHRREFVAWVTEAKKPETRTRRLEKAVAMVADGARLS